MRRLTIALVASFLAVCSCSDQLYRHYSRYSEAISTGELSRGWLPSWIPATAYDIHLQGDLDTGHVWVRFLLPPSVADYLKSQFKFMPYKEVEQLSWRWPRSASAWWFQGLIGRPPHFRHEFFIAFDRLSNNVYAWWVGPEK